MKIRKTQPKNNKYYIRTVTGGLNGAVEGYPTIAGANVLCNCVGYANGRFNEIINDPDQKGIVFKFKYQLVCNAENFIESAKAQGLKISNKPTKGGIMVWQKGATLHNSDGAGHVAVVEHIYDDGSILTSESGYNAWAFKTVKRNNKKGRWGQNEAYKFRGCIINPSVKKEQTVQDKICAWAKKIAKDNSYHYKRYTEDRKTHQCPICHDLTGKYKGWNCIGFAFACWHHGGGIPCKCKCDVFTDQIYNKMLQVSYKEAKKIASNRLGLSEDAFALKRNKGKALNLSKLKKGDIVVYYTTNGYKHTALWVGDGKIADSTSGRSDQIKYGVDSYKSMTIKLAFRYKGE